jgi:hypothetical protein
VRLRNGVKLNWANVPLSLNSSPDSPPERFISETVPVESQTMLVQLQRLKVLRARSEGEEKEEENWDLLPFLPFDDFHVSLFFDSIYYRERERESVTT